MPHLATIHEPIQEAEFRGVKGAIRMSGMRGLMGMVDCVHAVSEAVKQNLIDIWGRESQNVCALCEMAF